MTENGKNHIIEKKYAGGISVPTFREFTFLSSNGRTPIRVRRFDPDGAPRGVVQVAHGVAEHSARYDAFLTFLAEHGFVAAANDHLGHGESRTSEDETGWFAEKDGWDLVVEDMKKLHDLLHGELPGLPYALFGHSMGSFAARTYLIRYPDDADAAVICGTGQQSGALVGAGKAAASMICALKGTKYRSKLLQSMAFGSYNKGFEPVRTPVDWLSRDTAVTDAYMEDPLCGFTPSAGLFRDMMTGIGFIGRRENVERMNKALPALLIAGSRDPVGENGRGPARVYELWKAAGMRDVTLTLYPECRHELLNERNRDAVKADVLAFLEEKLFARKEEKTYAV